MNKKMTCKLCFFLVASILFSACSSVKVAKIEKRRYLKGYHVDIQGYKKLEAPVQALQESNEYSDKLNGSTAANHEESVINHIGPKLKSAKGLLSNKRISKALDKIDHSAESAITIETNKNLAGTTKHVEEELAKPQPGTGVSAVVLLIIFLVIFLLLIEPIVAILMAILLALLIVWLLRALDIID